MRRFFSTIALVGLAAQLSGVPAHAEGTSCNTALDRLMDEWRAVGYPMPEKPAQMQVVGNSEHEATGPQVLYMRSQISRAAQECEQGDSASALTHIDRVSGMLDKQAAQTASRKGQ
jgi:hypothetical protein